MDYTTADAVQVGFAAAQSNRAAKLESSLAKGKGMVDTVTMLPSDTTISIRIFLDTNVGEVGVGAPLFRFGYGVSQARLERLVTKFCSTPHAAVWGRMMLCNRCPEQLRKLKL